MRDDYSYLLQFHLDATERQEIARQQELARKTKRAKRIKEVQ